MTNFFEIFIFCETFSSIENSSFILFIRVNTCLRGRPWRGTGTRISASWHSSPTFLHLQCSYPYLIPHHFTQSTFLNTRAGNSLIWFPSESLFFCPKMSDLLTSLISSERLEWIAHGRSFLVSEMSDSLTSLIWFEQNERFTHITHQKRGNERKCAICSFFRFF